MNLYSLFPSITLSHFYFTIQTSLPFPPAIPSILILTLHVLAPLYHVCYSFSFSNYLVPSLFFNNFISFLLLHHSNLASFTSSDTFHLYYNPPCTCSFIPRFIYSLPVISRQILSYFIAHSPPCPCVT